MLSQSSMMGREVQCRWTSTLRASCMRNWRQENTRALLETEVRWIGPFTAPPSSNTDPSTFFTAALENRAESAARATTQSFRDDRRSDGEAAPAAVLVVGRIWQDVLDAMTRLSCSLPPAAALSSRPGDSGGTADPISTAPPMVVVVAVLVATVAVVAAVVAALLLLLDLKANFCLGARDCRICAN